MGKALVEIYLTPVPPNTLEGQLSKVFGHEGMGSDDYVLTDTTFTVYHEGRSATVEYNDRASFTVDLQDGQGIGLGLMVFILTLATVGPVSVVSPLGISEWASAIMIVKESLGISDSTIERILTGWRVTQHER